MAQALINGVNMKSAQEIIREIFKKGYLMSLATVDDSGPWVSDVIYVSDDQFNLFWLSQMNTRHSRAIATNSQVAATITVSNEKGEKNIGLQIEGQAKKLEGDDLKLATAHRAKRGKPAPTKEGEILDPGESWYSLKPTKIEVIYEPYWGFEKKVLEI